VRVLYLGLPLGALCLAARGHTPVAIVLGHPDAAGASRIRRRIARQSSALVLGRPSLEDPVIVRTLASLRPDVILSWFWPRRVPEHVLSLAPSGAYGVHPSLLPRWRGPDPYFWAIRSGDTTTGVTLHRLDASYDTGDVIEQRTLDIEPIDDAWRLARRLDRPSLALLLACADRLARGESLAGTSQDHTLATLAPAPSADDLAVRWAETAEQIVRLVRAAAPYPGATARIGDAFVEILEARVSDHDALRALEPSEAIVATDRSVIVRADDRGVRLVRVRTEDGHELRDPEIARLLSGPTARRAP